MSTGRTYSSVLREEQAKETKRRIRAAAAELFAADGFADTTVVAIARQAGVAAPTVYSAFGSKRGIVVSMLEELEENAELGVWVGRMMAADDPHEQLRLFAAWIRNMCEVGEPIIRAVLATRSEPDVAEVADRGDEARRKGTRGLATRWESVGALREGLSVEEAAERLWLMTGVEQYLQAVDRLGWSPARYEEWLHGMLERELLTP
jgi:AcrR family transcriptional regulator